MVKYIKRDGLAKAGQNMCSQEKAKWNSQKSADAVLIFPGKFAKCLILIGYDHSIAYGMVISFIFSILFYLLILKFIYIYYVHYYVFIYYYYYPALGALNISFY